MRLFLRSVLPALIAIVVASPGLAQSHGPSFYVTPFGGYALFDDDLHYPGTRQLKENIGFGARLGVQFNRWLGFELAGDYIPTEEDTAGGGRKVKFMHASGNIVLTPFATERAGVFLSVGGGAGRYKPEEAEEEEELNQGLLETAAGLRMNFTERLGLRLEARHMLWLPKEEIDKASIKTFLFGGGITLSFGGGPALDSDQDGVPDSRDECPNTPVGARVDERGCPQDADADAVPDGVDQCADTPRGCRVDARGCPIDSDGDKVCDGLDQCEGTPAGATVDARGCPADSDNDGVPDDKDKCPNTAAGLKVDAEGCPIEVIETERELMDTGLIRLEDVHFETAKWDILPEERPRLDIVGQVLTRWPELRIEIGGHTDARGTRAYNHDLSHKRAQAVLSYLLQAFPTLKPEQYTAKGYGEDRPIAPNNGEPNWGKNRRVEFKVLNRDVLKREVERRRLLRKDEPAPGGGQ